LLNKYPELRFIHEDFEGKIWLGFGSKGIGYLENKEIKLLTFKNINLENKSVSSIYHKSKNNWIINTFGNGVFLIDSTEQVLNVKDTLGFTSPGAFISHIEKDGNVWFATSTGLYYFDGKRFAKIKSKDGLMDNSFFNYLEDKSGNVWLPSSVGIVRLSKQELIDFVKNKIDKVHPLLYNEGDGLLSNQCTGARHSAITPDGKILVPTLNGLVEIDPSKLKTNTIPPKIVISPLLYNGQIIPDDSSHVFSSGNNQFTFQFSALSLAAPEKVRFQYMLEGYDKDWGDITNEHKAVYTSLPAGKYTFKVIGSNNGGAWNQEGDKLSFEVLPYFYETWWFRLLLLSGLILGILAFFSWRSRQIVLRNKELQEQIVLRTQELSIANDDLTNQKSSLENTLTQLKSTQTQLIQSEKLASLGELTAGIAHEIQNPLNFVNNFSEVSSELIDEMDEEID